MAKAQKKFYAVRVGRETGIFLTWEECKANVTGYSGAIYKSFPTLEEAQIYMNKGRTSEFSDTSDSSGNAGSAVSGENPGAEPGKAPVTDSRTAVAYVDGSFYPPNYSYGMVMFHNGEELHFNGKFSDPEMASMRNVAGEIEGSMAAMKYCLEKDIKKLEIHFDYEGIRAWALGEWQTNKKGTIAYKAFYQAASHSIDIRFVKVKGHSGDKYNDMADKLAKQALGLVSADK